MWLKNFLGFLTSNSTRRQPIRRRPLGSRTRLEGFEAFEDRWMPSAYSIVSIPLAAQDVNNNGVVAGQILDGQAGLWHDGTLITLGPQPGPGSWGVAYAINDAGQVVGDSSAGGFLITPEDVDGDGAPDRWYRDDNQDGVNDLITDLSGIVPY